MDNNTSFLMANASFLQAAFGAIAKHMASDPVFMASLQKALQETEALLVAESRDESTLAHYQDLMRSVGL